MIMGGNSPSKEHLTFATVTGYFLQDDQETDPKGFDYVRTLPDQKGQWLIFLTVKDELWIEGHRLPYRR